MKEYFVLKENVILVNGAVRGLIQDLNNKKIYSINGTAKEYINKLIKGMKVNELLAELNHENKESFLNYIDLLIKNNLAYYSHDKIMSGKYDYKKQIKRNFSTVWFELRKACNLNCCHCYMDCSSISDKKLKILSLNEWKTVVDNLKKHNPERIILIGGEPLLYKEIDELIFYIREKLSNTEIVLYSNLTLLNEQLINVLKQNKVKVITSVYSNKSEVHDKITDRKGSFHKTIANIKKLKAANIYVKANIVIMKYNSRNMSEELKFLYDLTGVKSKVDVVRDVGISKQYLLPENLGTFSKHKKLNANFKGINKDVFIRNYSGNSCWQGKINITCDGYVSPCIMSYDLINENYNVRKDSIDNIIDDYLIPEFWYMSKDYIEECRECEYRYVCKDCRPICIEGKNVFAKGNNCTYNPFKGLWNDK